MTWVRIDDKVRTHPKTIGARELYLEALGLWAAGLAHCNEHTTDGRIMKHELRSLAPVDDVPTAKLRRVAERLVDTGRWHDCGDHWLVHGYEDEQADALSESKQARREYERMKKKAQRQRRRAKMIGDLGGMSPRDSPPNEGDMSPGHGGDTQGDIEGTRKGTSEGTDLSAGQGLKAPSRTGRVPMSPAPGPARPGPARPREREALSPPVLEGGPLDKDELAVLAYLKEHPSLAPAATAPMARDIWSNGSGKRAKPLREILEDITYVANEGRAAQHNGQVFDACKRLLTVVDRPRFRRTDPTIPTDTDTVSPREVDDWYAKYTRSA